MITRDKALQIVRHHVKNENLVRHMLAVEVAMAFYAKKFSEDDQHWRIVGLLHDFDWEIHPTLDEHPLKGAPILRDLGVDEKIIQAILSHADYTGVPRDNLLRKTLFACDEITGLITTVALVRPSKKLADVKLKSIKKKWKDKRFAAGVNRADVEKGAADLNLSLDEHLQNVLTAMQSISSDLGL